MFFLLIFSGCFFTNFALARFSVAAVSMRSYLDPTEVAQGVHLIQDGTSMHAIVRRFAVSPSTASRARKRQGL